MSHIKVEENKSHSAFPPPENFSRGSRYDMNQNSKISKDYGMISKFKSKVKPNLEYPVSEPEIIERCKLHKVNR